MGINEKLAQKKFQLGQRVIVRNHKAYDGKKGMVVALYHKGEFASDYAVRMDKAHPRKQNIARVDEDQLEFVGTRPKPIVHVDFEGGQYFTLEQFEKRLDDEQVKNLTKIDALQLDLNKANSEIERKEELIKKYIKEEHELTDVIEGYKTLNTVLSERVKLYKTRLNDEITKSTNLEASVNAKLIERK